MTMKNMKYLILSATALFALAACQRNEVYTPAEKEEGAHFYFSSAEMTVAVDDSHVEPFIELFRTDADPVSKVISVNDTSGIFFSDKTAKFDFPAKIHKTKLYFSVVRDKLEIGTKYAIGFKIPSDASAYGQDSLTVIVDYPEPWTVIGNAVIVDKWLEISNDPRDRETGVDATIVMEQNALYPNRFRMQDPWGTLWAAKGYSNDNADPTDEYVYLTLLQPGDKVGSVSITISDPTLVYYDDICTGYYDAGNGGTHLYCHPSGFKSTPAETDWTHNCVVEWQEADEKGNKLPAIVQIAPFPYMEGIGGWNKSQEDGLIQIIFPGVDLSDFNISLDFEGVLVNKKENSAFVNLGFDGADVAKVALVVIPGDDPEDAFALIKAENENVVVVEEEGYVKVPVPAGSEPGKYSVVAVPLDEEGPVVDFAKLIVFVYGDVSPLKLEYSVDDLLEEPITKEKLFGTTWAAISTEEGDPIDREYLGSVTFEEADDVAAGSDRIIAHGFSYGGGEYYGFNDALYMEWYKGSIYTLANKKVGSAYGFDIIPVCLTDDGEIYDEESDYLMVGGYVEEGVIALVSAEEENFVQLWFGAFKDGELVDWFTSMKYILLVDPKIVDITDFIPSDPAPAPAKAIQKKYNLKKVLHSLNHRVVASKGQKTGEKLHKAEVVYSGNAVSGINRGPVSPLFK